MTENGKLVERRLTIEKNNITILQMSFDNISLLDILCSDIAVTVSERDLELGVLLAQVVRTRVDIRAIPNQFLDLVLVVSVHHFRVCKILRNKHWHSDFFDTQVGIGRNNGTAREINTLSGKIATETTLFTL